jgi:transcriptional regulator with XRE-family HTH domain
MTTQADLDAEVDARVRLAEIVGTPASRKALRLRLGLTLQQVSDLTGLTITSIAWRESKRWRMTRGSVESPEGWAYVRLLARAKGIDIDD